MSASSPQPASFAVPEPIGRAASALSLLLAGVVLAAFWAAKVRLFDGLEYTSDLFLFLQIATSAVDGRPLLHENLYGGHLPLHGYWLLPLFGPLVRWLGARAFFAVHLALLAAAAAAVAALALRVPAPVRAWGLAPLALLLGPVSFWLLDDPTYGWHVELLYVPLGCLFMAALIAGSRAAWLCAAAMVLLREDGAIVAWALHATWEMARPGRSPPRARLLRLGALTAGWVAVFALGMLPQLAAQGSVRGSRVSALLARVPLVLGEAPLRAVFAASFADLVLLLGAGALAVVLLLPRRAIAAAAACSLPLLAAAEVGSLLYVDADPRTHGVAWPERFAMFWALLVGAALLALQDDQAPTRPAARAGPALALLAVLGSCTAQVWALQARRGYSVVPRLSQGLLGARQPLQSEAFSAVELAALRCLGRTLPAGLGVTTAGNLYATFERQLIVQPDRLGLAIGFPEVFACDRRGRVRWDYGCEAARRGLPRGFSELRLEGLTVSSLARWRAVVEQCGFSLDAR